MPEKQIDLLWVPLGASTPAAFGQFRFIIHEDVWRCRPQAVKTRIHALLGLNKRLHGRQCVVKRIDKNTAQEFLNQYHTGGYVSAYYKFGLYFNNQLISCATFSKKRKLHRQANETISAELLRYAVKDGYYAAGGLHKLICTFISEIGINHLMTYADKEWTDGRSYKKTGFTADGDTPPLTFCVNTITFERSLLANDPASTETNNCLKVSNLGNTRFVWRK